VAENLARSYVEGCLSPSLPGELEQTMVHVQVFV
jgi:hypothetical protein